MHQGPTTGLAVLPRSMAAAWKVCGFFLFLYQSRENATHEQSTSIQTSASSHPLQTCKSAEAGVQRQIQSKPALKCCCFWLTVGRRQSISKKPQVRNLWASDRNVCVCAFQNANEGKSSSQKPNIRTSLTL